MKSTRSMLIIFALVMLVISLVIACGSSDSKGPTDNNADNQTEQPLIPEASGMVDDTFNGGEPFVYDGGADEYVWAMTLQNDNKIVVTGQSGADLLLMRLNADGTFDTGFGTNGIAPWELGFTASGRDVMVQKDGKILVAGYATCMGSDLDIMLARFKADGTPDLSFGSWGVVCWEGGKHETGFGMTIQPDGKIVVAGYQSTSTTVDLVMVRFNSNGSVDSTFGTDGATFWDSGYRDYAAEVELDKNGNLLVSGYVYKDSDIAVESELNELPIYDSELTVWRFKASGTLDTGFGNNGFVHWGRGTHDISTAMTLNANGQMLVTGYSRSMVTYRDDYILLRFNSDGSLDSTLDGDGVLIKDTFMGEHGADVVSMPNGKVLSGFTRSNGFNTTDIVLIRLNADGTFDEQFDLGGDSDGIVNWDSGNEDCLSGLAIQSRGNIIAAGYTYNGSDHDVLVLGFK